MASLTLRCKNCDCVDCVFSREYVPEGSLEGCCRKVDENIVEQYCHYFSEVIPFLKNRSYSARLEIYEEIMCFLSTKIFSAKIIAKLDKRGKVKYRPH
jgi:hypothetical protein